VSKGEFPSLLKHLDANIPGDLELHLIADNYPNYKHPKVKAWLASDRRFHLHFTAGPRYKSNEFSGARSRCWRRLESSSQASG